MMSPMATREIPTKKGLRNEGEWLARMPKAAPGFKTYERLKRPGMSGMLWPKRIDWTTTNVDAWSRSTMESAMAYSGRAAQAFTAGRPRPAPRRSDGRWWDAANPA